MCLPAGSSVFMSKFKGGNCYGLAQYQIQQQSLIAFKNQLKLLFPHTLAKNVFILHVYTHVRLSSVLS